MTSTHSTLSPPRSPVDEPAPSSSRLRQWRPRPPDPAKFRANSRSPGVDVDGETMEQILRERVNAAQPRLIVVRGGGAVPGWRARSANAALTGTDRRPVTRKFPENAEMWVSHVTIHQSLHVPVPRGATPRSDDVPADRAGAAPALRTRPPSGTLGSRTRSTSQSAPAEAEDRAVPGH